jgi:hypothetical protein
MPRELLKKMFHITHLAAVRCRFYNSDYDIAKAQRS